MGKELATTDTGKALAQVQVRVGSLYAAIRRDDRRRCDTLPVLIGAAERQQLQDYRRRLHARLQPLGNAMADKNFVQGALVMFLGSYASLRGDPTVLASHYTAMLDDQPRFAVLAAIEDFRQLRVFDFGKDGERIPFTMDHAPSAMRIMDQAKKHAAEVYEERHKVTRLLAITEVAEPEVAPEEQARVGEAMRQLSADMGRMLAATRAQDRQEIREQADAARERARRIVEDARARREFESAEARVIG